MKEFFGLSKEANGGYGFLRSPEGAWSWQHILQVSIFMILMVSLAIVFGKKYKKGCKGTIFFSYIQYFRNKFA